MGHRPTLNATTGRVIAIVDHPKWERAAFATFCPTDEITIVLSDQEAPRAMVEGLEGRGVEVRLVASENAAR